MVLGMGMSKPCKQCLQTLQKYNIRRVYYTIPSEDGNVYYKVERSRDMISEHMSYGAKQFYKYY